MKFILKLQKKKSGSMKKIYFMIKWKIKDLKFLKTNYICIIFKLFCINEQRKL